jgi:hypothetical protein
MIGINETRRNIDSSIDESRCIVLSPSDIYESKQSFNFNCGMVSDGKLIRLSEPEIYYKITANISMITDSGTDEDSYLYRASERPLVRKPSVNVYADGLKIPDNEVLFYPTRSNVDVFIPLRYIDDRGAEIVIERKLYNVFPYIRYYEARTSGQRFSIQLDYFAKTKGVIKDRTVMVFVDKKLYHGKRNIIFINDDCVEITFYNELTDVELEIIIDSNISYFLIQNPMPSGATGVFEIPETYIDSIHGPVSKFSCSFFADGKRLLNDLISQEGRLHFSYNFKGASTAVLSMYITDIGYIADSAFTLYGSDYYLYNMIGSQPITKALKDGSSGTIFDGNINFPSVLSNKNKLYDRMLINEQVDKFYSTTTPEEKVISLLEKRPYLVRPFLENYGKKLYTYIVDYNGSDPYVYIGLPDTFELGEIRDYDININTHHIPSNEFEIINKDVTDVFKIPSKLFNNGKNIIEVDAINQYEIEYKRITPDVMSLINDRYVAVIDEFERFVSLDDLYILKKSSGVEGIMYPTDRNTGYVPFTGAEISYDSENRKIIITFDDVPDSGLILYSSNFSHSFIHQKPIMSSALDIILPLYSGSMYDPIPIIPKGRISLYAGKNKLIYGIDYFIKHPVNEDNAAGSFIIVKRAIMPGTTFDIYITNILAKNIMRKAGYFMNNPYGLFYLGNLRYPVSLKYLDIYINNKKCTEADIDILSDKLIRIHSLYVPMYDLSVESTFTIEEEYLEPYIDLYKLNRFEKYIESLFRGVWFNRPYIPNEEVEDYNSIYEGFIDSVDSVFKRPNPTALEREWIPSSSTDNPIGIYNDGSAMGGNDIYCSIIAGNVFIVAGEGGRIASCNVESRIWNSYDSGENISHDGERFEGNITSITFYKGYIIFATDESEIGFYDIVNEKWGYPGDASSGITLNSLPKEYFPTAIRKILVYEKILIIAGDGGNVASYRFDADMWYAYDNKDVMACFTVKGILGDGENIYDAFITSYMLRPTLVVLGSGGKAASGYLDINSWTYPTGQRYNYLRQGPLIFHDGSNRDYKDIYKITEYLNYYALYGEDGLVTLYSKESCKFNSAGDPKHISNTGHHNGHKNIYAAINYEGSILIAGSSEGKISSYYGENEHWNEHDSGSGISNNGSLLDGNDIYTIEYTFGSTNYIIFSGKNGKIGSYNVDVHELPFRFDPYKTAFLLWYKTPGNAYIKATWDIPHKVIDLFSVYKDNEDGDYDIKIAGGDTDIVADIDMNDRGRYPAPHAQRRRYIIDFIRSLPEGRYSPDEIWGKYMESKHKHILYPWDVIPLAGGDKIESEEDVDITNNIIQGDG